MICIKAVLFRLALVIENVHVQSLYKLKDPGRSKYNHTSMESLVDVEYKYIRINIVFPFHKLQDAERTSHCPPPPSYVTYLVRLAETLMTSFRVGVAKDVRPLELLWLARARRVNGFVHNHNSYSTFVGGVCEVLWKFWFSDGCLSKPRWLVGSVGEWRGWY